MNPDRDQQLASLFVRTHAGIKLDLAFMRELLEAVENPQQRFLSIHVAGTNGKGSTCAMLEAGVRAHGLKSGLFSSPHLVRVNERIQVMGIPLSDKDFYGVLDQVQRIEGSLSRLPTFFETLTAMAFLAFAQAGVQVAVLETGLGGRLDCTNVVEPLLSVITRVDMDHQHFLGDTLSKIASEKAGIIKPGRPVIVGAQEAEADKVLCERAQACGSRLIRAEEAIGVSGRRQDLTGQRFTLASPSREYGRIRFPLLGRFQLENVCTAVAALELFEELLSLPGEGEGIRTAVQEVNWPGRGQVLSTNPPILLDVAHNPGGAKALNDLLLELFGRKARGVLVWGGLADKDLKGFIRLVRPRFSRCVCVALNSPRAASVDRLLDIAEGEGLKAEAGTLSGLRSTGSDWVGDADFGCVAGSVYLAGEWLSDGQPDVGEVLESSEGR
ncbi:MAG: folylpolyglutamate synthase/dihydrofolate synthase family protein [Kiritimatiellia bacterium]